MQHKVKLLILLLFIKWSIKLVVIAKSHGHVCKNQFECNELAGLICEAKTCKCLEDFYFDGIKCVKKNNFGKNCNNDEQCDSFIGLYCLGKKCICGRRFKYEKECKMKNTFMKNCKKNEDCIEIDGLLCSSVLFFPNKIKYRCQCNKNSLYDHNSKKCIQFIAAMKPCSYNNQCDNSKGLACVAKKCNCKDQSKSWNGKTCVISRKLKQACSANDPCDERIGLKCIKGKCECATNQYHDGKKCAPLIAAMKPCSNNNQCDNSKGLACVAKKCNCKDQSKSWNGKTCVISRKLKQACSKTNPCDARNGLTCIKGKCGCGKNHFYKGKKCAPLIGAMKPCSNNNQCDNSKGLACVAKKCNCKDQSKSWNGKTCVMRLGRFVNATHEEFFQKKEFEKFNGIDFSGNNIKPSFRVDSVDNCEKFCSLDDMCFSFSFKNNYCSLKFRYKFQFTAIKDPKAISGALFLIKHCVAKIKLKENFQYSSNSKREIRNSTPDECCMFCYYNKQCIAWHVHKRSRICVLTLSKGFIKQSNSHFISGMKPIILG